MTAAEALLVPIVTHGTDGDVLPFVSLARELSRRGHQPVVITHYRYRELVEDAGAVFEPIDDADGYQRHQALTPRLLRLRGPDDLRRFYEDGRLFDQIRLEMRIMTEIARPGRTVLVGRHTSAISTLLVGEARRLPCIWVALSPAQPMLWPLAALNYELGLGDWIAQFRQKRAVVPAVATRLLPSPQLQLGLWPDWFDAAGVRAPSNMHLCGFVLGDENRVSSRSAAAERAMDDEFVVGRCVVSGGTGIMLAPDFYEFAIEAVLLSGFRPVVVCPHSSLLPARLSNELDHVSRLDFARTLWRAAAIVHHGGIGTMARAFAGGVPQIALTCGGDRPDNGARLAALGAGLWLDHGHWTMEAAAAYVAASMSTEQRCVRRLGDSEASVDRLVRWIEALASGEAAVGKAGHSDA